MAKTALQQLIEQWEIEINGIDETESYLDRVVKHDLRVKIRQAKDLLPIERQQIEEAFNAGYHDGLVLAKDNKFTYASNYYQSKYKESKGE